jgi:hypothetical protein
VVQPEPLRLLAQGADDLSVISTALQDAIGKIGDITYEPGARRLTVALNRYRWEAGAHPSQGSGQRVRCGLQFGSVLAVQERRLRQGAKKAVVALLSITFEPGEAPGGSILLTFAGGGDLKLTVECIDVVMADVSTPWPAAQRPSHTEG